MGTTCVDHLGNEYNSIKEMCEYYNVTYHAFNNRVDRGCSLDDALTKGARKSKVYKDHKGIEYNTFKSMCDSYKLEVNTVNKRLASGWSLEKALTTERSKIRVKSLGRQNRIDHKGISYDSWQDMCNSYGISLGALRTRLRSGWTLKDALEFKKNEYKDHLGNTYKTQAQMAQAFNIPLRIFTSRVRSQWTLKEILETPLNAHDKPIRILGNNIKNMREAGKKFGIAYGTLRRRLDIMDIEVALLEKTQCNFEYVGLNNKAYYRVGWSEELVTARDIVAYNKPDSIEVYDKENPTGEYRPYQK